MTEYEKWLYEWYFDMLKHYSDKRKVERKYKYKKVDIMEV